MSVKVVKTQIYDGMKPGTSGLRKKAKVFEQEHYVENFVQATLSAVGVDALKGETLVVGGDGRYYNKVMVQKIINICAANGVGKVVIGENGLLSTPAVSCLIRKLKAAGGFILTASHNPGGPTEDCGIKYNVSNGGPAPEKITNEIYRITTCIKEYKTLEGSSEVDLSKVGSSTQVGGMTVEIIDATEAYCQMFDEIFDFGAIKALLDRPDFTFIFDGMHGVAGPYAKRIFNGELGVPMANLFNCEPSETFNGGHPDPNLTYASELVARMGLTSTGKVTNTSADIPQFGAACDGDADRNMVLGKQFFVTPSDSLAVIAANADCIPFFSKKGLKTVARSMPTSGAVDLVAKKKGFNLYEVPTGWKYFGNLMDSAALGKEDLNPLICGEESFGTGSNHIREKDGIFAVLVWLSILASKNSAGKPLVTVQQIVEDHWKEYGRNYYSRYDYEGIETAKAELVFARVGGLIDMFNLSKGGVSISKEYTLSECDIFEYLDPVDSSRSPNQGWRFIFSDGSRFVLRKSGTGSSGITIRLYLEKYDKSSTLEDTAEALKPLIDIALELTSIAALTGRESPTVIT